MSISTQKCHGGVWIINSFDIKYMITGRHKMLYLYKCVEYMHNIKSSGVGGNVTAPDENGVEEGC